MNSIEILTAVDDLREILSRICGNQSVFCHCCKGINSREILFIIYVDFEMNLERFVFRDVRIF